MTNNLQHIQNLVVLANVDGVIESEEINVIHQLAEEIGISSQEVDHWLDNAEALILTIPNTNEEREQHLIDMINLSNSDGHFSNAEYELCQLMAEKLPYNGLKQAITRKMNRSYLKNLVALAASDGKIDPREMELLRDAATKAGVDHQELLQMLETAEECGYFIPESYEDRETQLIQMLSLAIADGEFSESEYELCKLVAEKLDFTERELNLIIKLSFRGKMEFEPTQN